MLAARQLIFSKLLAARKTNLVIACAREIKHSARMLAKTAKTFDIHAFDTPEMTFRRKRVCFRLSDHR